MRITGGTARGIPLLAPKGNAVRPATDSLRQSLFSSLSSRIVDAHFIDLFAGSGSYGLEAFSRGAAGGVFVEKNAKAADCLRKNISAVCKSGKRSPADLRVSVSDALKWRPSENTPAANLIFIDPPYEIISDIASVLFKHLSLIAEGSNPLLVFEAPGEISLAPENWTLVKKIGKGTGRQPTLSIFSK